MPQFRLSSLARPLTDCPRELYRTAAAVIFPAQEDFGIISVEAQATGAPVVALRRAGSLDTVVDGLTGVLVEQLAVAFAAGVDQALRLQTPSDSYVRHVEQFSILFRRRFAEWVRPWVGDDALASFGSGGG